MAIVGAFILVIFIISAILLIIIVMLQDEQGDGLGGIFGGGGGAAFGSRSGNILTKTTTILGTIFILSSIGNTWISRTSETGNVLGVAQEQAADSKSDWWNQPQTAAPSEQTSTDTAK